MNVSIIIVNYNTKKLLSDCLTSIFAHTNGISYEILVVDNASVDGSQEMIINDFPDVFLIASDLNLGFGKANNLGAKKAKGEFLFLLNSDTVLQNNAVKIFYDFFKNSAIDKIGGIGCLLENKEGLKIHSSGDFPTIKKILSKYLFSYLDKLFLLERKNNEKLTFVKNQSYFEVNYITGADLFISKDVFLQVNGFDKDFFLYYEETDMQKRMSYLGFTNYIIEGPKIIHLVNASSKGSSLKLSTIQLESMYLYLLKHSNKFSFCIFKFMLTIIRFPVLFDFRYSIKDRLKYLRTLILK